MKPYFKNGAKIFFITHVLFFFTNCEKDSPSTIKDDGLSSNGVKTITYQDLLKDNEFLDISNAFSLQDDFSVSKNQISKDDDFDIDYSSAKKVVTSLGSSYTFLIKSKDLTSFDNLVVEKSNDGKISGFIIRYEYSQRYLDGLQKGVETPFEVAIQRTVNKSNLNELKDVFKKKDTQKTTVSKSSSFTCVETAIIRDSKCYWGVHWSGQYCNKLGRIWYGYYITTSIQCTGNNLTDTWGWIAESGSYTTTVPDPNITSQGSSYSTTAIVEPSLFDDLEDIQSFVDYYGLEGDEIEWARYRPNRNVVFGFMEENDYSPEAEAFVKLAANALVNGGEVDFDDQIINTLTGKALCVYNKLQSSSTGFKNAIKKFDGDFPVAHLKFEVDTNMSSNTKKAFTRAPENYVIDIVLNGNSTKDASYQKRPNLLVAKTIIHEVIHAEMFRKLLSLANNNGNIDVTSLNQMLQQGDYPGMLDYYFRYGNNINSNWQHQQMAAHYRETIARFLQEFDTGTVLDNNTQPNQLYLDLAWEGLIYSNITAWQGIMDDAERTRIVNVISNYITNNLNQTCVE